MNLKEYSHKERLLKTGDIYTFSDDFLHGSFLVLTNAEPVPPEYQHVAWRRFSLKRNTVIYVTDNTHNKYFLVATLNQQS